MGDLSVLHLPSGPTALVAKVHPVVLFNISDAYIRRNEGQERVIGTLLGTVSSDGMVEIKNSYAVPHKETSDEVSMSQLLPLLSSGFISSHCGNGMLERNDPSMYNDTDGNGDKTYKSGAFW